MASTIFAYPVHRQTFPDMALRISSLRRMRVFVEERLRRQDHAGRTESALDGMMFNESFLDRVKFPFLCQTLYRRDLFPLRQPPAAGTNAQAGRPAAPCNSRRPPRYSSVSPP